MAADYVVDVGNTRMKWGRCAPDGITDTAAMPLVDPAAWQKQTEEWAVSPGKLWALTGVHPERRDYLANWLIERGQKVRLIQLAEHLPVQVQVERPDLVGIDRLLNAVAANARRNGKESAIVIDAGSAVTVDWVDAQGVFRGGAIFPGFRTMAKSLHDFTAMLPIVEICSARPALPGSSTQAAIELGIISAVAGGARLLIERLRSERQAESTVFITGGDGPLLAAALGMPCVPWPEMTLEGVRLSASQL